MADETKKILNAIREATADPLQRALSQASGKGNQSDNSRRMEIANAIERSEQSTEKAPVDSGEHRGIQDAIEGLVKKYLPEIVAFISLEALAIPFFHAGAEAMVNGHLERGVYAYVVGGISAAGGFTYYWWKKWPIWKQISRFVAPLWPVPLLLLFVYIAGPEMYRRALLPLPAPATTGFTQQQVDQKIIEGAQEAVAKAVAPLNAQIAQLQTKIDELKHQRDAALSHSPQATPQIPKPANLSTEEIAAKIVVWKSIELQMDGLTTILNTGNNVLSNWALDFRTDPSRGIGKIADFTNEVATFRAKLARLRDNYINYPEIADALKEAIVSGGRPPVPGTIFDGLIRSSENLGQELRAPPQDFEIALTPHVGALKRDLDAVIEWRNKTQRLAADQEKQLSSVGGK